MGVRLCLYAHARACMYMCVHTQISQKSIVQGLRHGLGWVSVCATEAHGARAHAAGARGNSGGACGRGEKEQRRCMRQGREGTVEVRRRCSRTQLNHCGYSLSHASIAVSLPVID